MPGLQNHPTLLNIYLNMLFFSTNSILYNTLIGVPYYNYGLWHLATLVEEGGERWEVRAEEVFVSPPMSFVSLSSMLQQLVTEEREKKSLNW